MANESMGTQREGAATRLVEVERDAGVPQSLTESVTVSILAEELLEDSDLYFVALLSAGESGLNKEGARGATLVRANESQQKNSVLKMHTRGPPRCGDYRNLAPGDRPSTFRELVPVAAPDGSVDGGLGDSRRFGLALLGKSLPNFIFDQRSGIKGVNVTDAISATTHKLNDALCVGIRTTAFLDVPAIITPTPNPKGTR